MIAGLLILTLVAATDAPASPAASIVPRHFILRYRNGESSIAHVAVSHGGRTDSYDFFLEPAQDERRDLFSFTVTMHCQCAAFDENLMYDRNNWHGMQPFMFYIADAGRLRQTRTVALRTSHLKVSMALAKAVLCPGQMEERQFCEAAVDVRLDPLP
ncbi:MAG TPA: hypothetical protein VH331_08510 [Allosphingosinicella sp.]|nr:hypothetical protein [Allosphingosinicella sp.]